MASNKHLRRVIVRLLGSMGTPKEVQQYLKRFSDLDGLKFAVVKVGGAIIENQLGDLASSLTFLQQVGLTPIVIHGGGPQLTRALSEQNIETHKRDGFRVTSPDALKVARRVFQTENLRLTAALREAGSDATSITGGVFEARLLDKERYGMVGEVTDVDIEPVRAVTGSGHIPVISPLAETADGQILNINGDVAANALVEAVQPFKIIFLTGTGGILDAQDKIISSINLSTDFERLMQQDWLHSGMRLKLQQIQQLLSQLPRESSVSITRPELLPRELFTHRGSGTLVRLGEDLHALADWSDVDTARLSTLLESSFGKTLKPDYFRRTALKIAYVSDSYRAAAIICAGPNGIARLDKFAVTEAAQGEGIGSALWHRVRKAHGAMYWRARPGNAINTFYFRHADGFVRTDEWLVFWYGIEQMNVVQTLIDDACALEATMLSESEA
ncbi:MAG: acetylglutamate kinase [Gammaproteobacteria bacterium]